MGSGCNAVQPSQCEEVGSDPPLLGYPDSDRPPEQEEEEKTEDLVPRDLQHTCRWLGRCRVVRWVVRWVGRRVGRWVSKWLGGQYVRRGLPLPEKKLERNGGDDVGEGVSPKVENGGVGTVLGSKQ